MRCLIYNEIYKTGKQKYFLLLISSAVILGIVTIGLNQALVSTHPQIVNTGSKMFISSLKNISVSIILCVIFIHFHIGNEYANRTITTMIESGFSRIQIYFAKVITCNIYCAGLMLLYPIVSSVGTACLNGWGEKAFIIDILGNVFIFLILNFSILAFCVVIDFSVENNVISLIFNILIVGIGTEILLGISTELQVLEKILNMTPIGKISLIGKTMLRITDYVTVVVISVIWSGAILMLGYDRFRKLDIK